MADILTATSRRLFGAVTVESVRTMIEISGISTMALSKDMQNLWSTSKVTNNIFSTFRGTQVAFKEFFAPDILYTIDQLLETKRTMTPHRHLLAIRQGLLENTWLKSTITTHDPILDFRLLENMTIHPLAHQEEFLVRYDKMVPAMRLKGYLLSSPAGTGKTYAGLAWSECIQADCVIVIAPNNSVYRVWKDSIESMIKGSPKTWVSQDKLPLNADYKFYVFHYEAIEKVQELFSIKKPKRAVIILDESHNFNEISAQRTQRLMGLSNRPEIIGTLWSSGTPLKAIGTECITLLRSIDPFFDSNVEVRFRAIYGASVSRAVDMLRNRIGLISYKTDKSLVVSGTPIVEDIPVTLKNPTPFLLSTIREDMKVFILERVRYYKENKERFQNDYLKGLNVYQATIRTPEQRKEFDTYKAYVDKIIRRYDPWMMKEEAAFCNRFEEQSIMPALNSELKAKFREAKSVVKYVNLKIQGECLGRVLGKRRTECNRALVENSGLPEIIDNAIKKTVIFTSYVDVVEDVDRYLSGEGFDPVLVYGDTNKDVNKLIEKFDKDPKANPIVATFQSLSTAVPLIMANTVVMMNVPFRSYEYEQAVSRVNRLGQDSQVYVFRALLDTGDEPNISTRTIDIMQWSMEQVAMLMGEKPLEYPDDTTDAVSRESYDFEVGYYLPELKPKNKCLEPMPEGAVVIDTSQIQ